MEIKEVEIQKKKENYDKKEESSRKTQEKDLMKKNTKDIEFLNKKREKVSKSEEKEEGSKKSTMSSPWPRLNQKFIKLVYPFEISTKQKIDPSLSSEEISKIKKKEHLIKVLFNFMDELKKEDKAKIMNQINEVALVEKIGIFGKVGKVGK